MRKLCGLLDVSRVGMNKDCMIDAIMRTQKQDACENRANVDEHIRSVQVQDSSEGKSVPSQDCNAALDMFGNDDGRAKRLGGKSITLIGDVVDSTNLSAQA